MKKNNQFTFNKAFTLAEVLITLGIIGVVAALIIPTLIQNQEKKEIASKVMSNYSIISRATASIVNDCGGDIEGCLLGVTTPNDGATLDEIARLYKEKLSLALDCTSSGTGCFANYTYSFLNNNPWVSPNAQPWRRIMLANGASVAFQFDGSAGASIFISIFIDINGPKSPNKVAKDTFVFYYDKYKENIKPRSDSGSCDDTNDSGYGCAGKVIQEGAVTYY